MGGRLWVLCFPSSCSSALGCGLAFFWERDAACPSLTPSPPERGGGRRSWGAPPGCPPAAALEFHHGQCTAAWEKWATAWPGQHVAQRNWLLWSWDLPLQQAARRELQAALGAQGPLLREHPPPAQTWGGAPQRSSPTAPGEQAWAAQTLGPTCPDAQARCWERRSLIPRALRGSPTLGLGASLAAHLRNASRANPAPR